MVDDDLTQRYPCADWCCAKGCPGPGVALCTTPPCTGKACTCGQAAVRDEIQQARWRQQAAEAEVDRLRAELAGETEHQHVCSDIAAANERLGDALTTARGLIAQMVPVVRYVSQGAEVLGVEPYPVAAARIALGAVDDAGLTPPDSDGG